MLMSKLSPHDKIVIGLKLEELGAKSLSDVEWDRISNLKPFVGVDCECVSYKDVPVIDYVEDFEWCRNLNPTLRRKPSLLKRIVNLFRG